MSQHTTETLRTLAAQTIVVISSLVFSLLLLEGGLRLYFHFVENSDIEMWKYAQLLKTSVPDARSHIHLPGQSAFIMGHEIRINSKGLRDRERPYEKPAGVYRILVLGDSFTMGFGVGQDQTFCRLLENALNARSDGRRYEVINAGVGNYNTVQETAALELEGYKYRPDHILLAFYINDAEPTQRYRGDFATRHFITVAFFKIFLNRLRAVLHPSSGYKAYYSGLYQGEHWRAYAKILDDFVEQARRTGAKTTVVLLPDLHCLEPYPFLDADRKLRRYLEARHCDVIDALQAFPPVPDGRRFWAGRDDPHPNAAAHALIAALLERRLRLD